MPRFWLALVAAVSFSMPVQAADDPVFEAYLQSLFLVPGKAVDEFGIVATRSPLLTSYALALFAETRCGIPEPSKALIDAAGGAEAFNTEGGQRVFVVAGVVATMTYKTSAEEASFCANAKELIRVGEQYVIDHPQ